MSTELEQAEREIRRLQSIIMDTRVTAWNNERQGNFTIAELEAFQHRVRVSFAMPPYCCDLHNAHCEPPSELCCAECTEARHPEHPRGARCVLDIARDRMRGVVQ